MENYKIVTLKELALEVINHACSGGNVLNLSLATDFDIDHQIGDVVTEFEVSCFYDMCTVFWADTVLCACVYSGGKVGNNVLFDINLKFGDDIEEMAQELADVLKEYMEVYGDNLIAMSIKE